MLHCFKPARYLLDSGLPFSNLLLWRLWLDQGIEQKIGVLELDNNFPKSLGLSDCSKLDGALKDMLIGLINILLDRTTTCAQLCLLNDEAVLHLLQLGDFLGSFAL